MFRIGEIGQWIGMAASVAGLAVEMVYGADLGFVLITAGALAWAVATKVKYYRRKMGGQHVKRFPGW
jgi:hypothetical protein